jgi:hypothetical protein
MRATMMSARSRWLLALLTFSAGCGSSGTSPGPDGGDAAVADAVTTDGPLPGDSAGDATESEAGAEAEAGVAAFMATVRLDRLAQDCQSMLVPDPLEVTGTLEITNTGGIAIGPVTASQAILTSEGLMELGRFSLGSVQLDAVPPGATRSVPIMKMMASLMPANGCGTSCGMLLRVRVPIAGSNVPVGAIVNSPLTPLVCTR